MREQLELAPFAAHEAAAGGLILWCNRAARALYGPITHELDLFADRADGEVLLEQTTTPAASIVAHPTRIRTPSGECHAELTIITSATGRLTYTRPLSTDAEREAERVRRRVQLLGEASRAFA